MDSLYSKKLSDIYSLLDSLLVQTNDLQVAVDAIKSESLFLKFLPFIGVIVGGLITYFGQYLLKTREVKLVISKSINDTINKMYVNINLITFYLKDIVFSILFYNLYYVKLQISDFTQ